MEDIESLLSKKKEKSFFKEKDLFLRLIKNKEDTLFHKKCHNKYINDLKTTISDGLTILSETGFDSERRETKKKDLLNNNNSKNKLNNKKNSKKILYNSGRNLKFLQNNIKSERSLLTSPNSNSSNEKSKDYYFLRDAFFDNFFVLYNRNSPRIKSSYTHQNEIHKTNNFINSNYFTLNKDSKIFPSFNKTKRFSLNPYNTKNENIKRNNFSKPGSNYNSNKSLKSHRMLSPKKPLKPFKTLSPEKEKNFINPINSINSNNKLKLRAERKIRNMFNNTILKFNRNKLKFHSPKNIKKRIAKLSEPKVKNKNLMKEFNSVKTIVTDFMKKKKKTAIEFKNKSLSYKRIQNEKKIFFKKAFRQYFSPPYREMKVELANYIKNRYFIVDENNNPFKFRIFRCNHIF